ncbi:type II toxin-antitoxin system VapB family antitoxin [Paraoerskovia marina]|uniref:Antitoxin VapB n=1 Tax=Paraoerskovia marina TaxID=545619 RepID=A0A1H1MLQ6_9CELL|nr:type II toxin-antitoxin system VapB family antitoxin [Paraoerskovia marina]SDR87751.1 hypothetical protein SAMN04489860_0279 [Paraoerskovia marina]
MSLNIKNERTHALVRQLAELTGTSQTSAVEGAVRRQLEAVLAERERSDEAADARRRRAGALIASLRADLTDADRAALRVADGDLFDESGLPA